MELYPVWFDLVVALLIATGCIRWLVMATMDAGPRRGKARLTAILLIGFGVILGGTGGIFLNVRAARLRIVGVILSAHTHVGSRNNQSSTSFYVASPTGGTGLTIDTIVHEVSANEVVDVSYQEKTHRVLKLHVLEGSSAGYQESWSDGRFGAIGLAILGIVITLYGVFGWVTDKNAIMLEPVASQAPSDGRSDSFLHLND